MKHSGRHEGAGVKNSRLQTGVQARGRTEVSTAAIIGISTMNALIGTWAVACFVGGLVAAGGPLSFVESWFTAVTGI